MGMRNEKSVENSLVIQVAQGDQEALAELYSLHATEMLNLARRIVMDEDDANDLIHDLFLLLPKRIKSFRGESTLSTWLFRLVTNESISFLRKKRRRSSLLNRFFSSASEEVEAPSQEKGEYKEIVDQLLMIYPPQIRAMLWMKEAEGIDLKSIAEVMKLPEGTVKSRMSRAKQKGLRWLEENGYGTFSEIIS